MKHVPGQSCKKNVVFLDLTFFTSHNFSCRRNAQMMIISFACEHITNKLPLKNLASAQLLGFNPLLIISTVEEI